MNIGVLLSGGTGSRISSKVPKQYVRMGDRLMVTHALVPLLGSSHIDQVHIVSDEAWRDLILSDVKAAGFPAEKIRDFAKPGANRQTSIMSAMENILSYSDGNKAGKEDTVLIHDAARPFLTEKMIDMCYEALPGHDGVMPVLPMKDTVYLSEDGSSVSELIDRSSVFAGQAPELFNLEKYYQANKKLMPDLILKINGATEPAVMDGMDIVMIPGDEGNFKVTTDADLERYNRVLQQG